MNIDIEYTWHTLHGTQIIDCFFGCKISDGQTYVLAKAFHRRSVQLCYTHANPLIPFKPNQRKHIGKEKKQE